MILSKLNVFLVSLKFSNIIFKAIYCFLSVGRIFNFERYATNELLFSQSLSSTKERDRGITNVSDTFAALLLNPIYRWHNHLNPSINKEAWTQEEELILIRAHQIHGNRWAELTKYLPGRCVLTLSYQHSPLDF